jgi:acyl-CoA oxidase
MAADDGASEQAISSVLATPDLAPLLPLLYVAWADGQLEPEELDLVCKRLRASSPACADPAVARRWLDPERPPAAEDLANLLAELRRVAARLPKAERLSLTALSRELAESAGRAIAPEEERALAAIEHALGLEDRPLLARIFGRRAVAAQEPATQAAFDASALARHLDGDRAALRTRIEALLLSPDFAPVSFASREAYCERVLAWCRKLADEGVSALGLPLDAGGAGDLPAFLAALEVLAYHDLSLWVKFGVQFGLFAGAIQQLGTERHHQRYLAAAARLDLPGCFAMTETDHGSDVASLETTATYDAESGQFLIQTPHDGARKDFIGGAARDARLAVVFAQLRTAGEGHGVHAFLVPVRRQDGTVEDRVRIEDCGEKLGLNGVDNGRLWFDGVRIPRENLLDRFASVAPDGTYASPISGDAKRFFVTLGTLVGGRVNVAIAAGSAAKKALTIAIRYGARRRQFAPADGEERPVLDYFTHQLRLQPRLATTFALHFAQRDLVARYLEAPADRRPLEALAAGLKAYGTWHTTDTVQACREACGGAGYMAENRLAALKADTDVFTTFEGDNTVLCQLLVKGLLTGYRQQYARMTALAFVRHLGARAAVAAAELNPIVVQLTDERHLRGRDFQRDALKWREERLLGTLARRLARRIDGGMDAFLALQECGGHALALARAHVERALLERFLEGVDRCPDAPARAVLDSVSALFALSRIDADAGWFLEHGVIASGKARSIRRLVQRLCGELRPHAVALVDAFAIPEELVGAVISRPAL